MIIFVFVIVTTIIIIIIVMMFLNLSEMYGRGPCKAESPWGWIRVQGLTMLIIRTITRMMMTIVMMKMTMRMIMVMIMVTCHPLLLNRVNPLRLPPLAIHAATLPKPSTYQ